MRRVGDILTGMARGIPDDDRAPLPPDYWTKGWSAEERWEYELQHWLPRLGADAFCLVAVLRSLAHGTWSPEHPWGTCVVSLADLARRLGRNAKTVARQLRRPDMDRFVSWRQLRRRDPSTGEVLRGVRQYRVAMFTPLVPEHDKTAAVIRQALGGGQKGTATVRHAFAEGQKGSAPVRQAFAKPDVAVPSAPGKLKNGPEVLAADNDAAAVVSESHGERSNMKQILEKLGMDANTANTIVERYPLPYLKGQIEAFVDRAKRAKNPAGYIRAAIERGYGRPPGRPDTLPPAVSPAADSLGRRFYAWYLRRLEAEGIGVGRGGREPETVRARRVAWLVLARLGLGVREIARVTGASPGGVAKGLKGEASLAAEVDAWERRFRDAVDLVSIL